MTGFRTLVILTLAAFLLTGCFARKKYENPIDRDTAQPDKILFDKAINDLERGRFVVSRLTLNTLINTYDTSEYLAKSKLALADSWFREGGAQGLAQAEAEYKDFILFYPTLEEAPEAQERVCLIHYRQMEKPDRDQMHAIRADDECRQLMVQFPNSKFAPRAEQTLRQVQEVIAEGEYRVGQLYYKKGSYPASVNRMEGLANQYPLYSKADEALWKVGISYGKMGPQFREQSLEAFQRIVRDYPLSQLAEQSKQRLNEMEGEIPEPDPVALARMEYEAENYTKQSTLSRFWGVFSTKPNVRAAAKSGTPSETTLRPTVPPNVPLARKTLQANLNADVTASTISGDSALDTEPDARQNPPDASNNRND